MVIPDYVSLEMTMANLMAIQEASGFKFDMDAAERVRQSLACEAQSIQEKNSGHILLLPWQSFLFQSVRQLRLVTLLVHQ